MSDQEGADMCVQHARLVVPDDESEDNGDESDDTSIATTILLKEDLEDPEDPEGGEVESGKEHMHVEGADGGLVQGLEATDGDLVQGVEDVGRDALWTIVDKMMGDVAPTVPIETIDRVELSAGISQMPQGEPNAPSLGDAVQTDTPTLNKNSNVEKSDDSNSSFVEYVTTKPAKCPASKSNAAQVSAKQRADTKAKSKPNNKPSGKPSSAQVVAGCIARLAERRKSEKRGVASGRPTTKQNGKQGAKRSRDDDGDFEDSWDDDSDFESPGRPARKRPTPPKLPAKSPSLAKRWHEPKVSLRFLLESTKFRWNLPRPSIRDLPSRTFGHHSTPPIDPELVPARWPSHVIHLADSFNPDDINVPGSPPFQSKCYCRLAGDCRADTCANAKTEVYCDELSCPFEGVCGNGTRTDPRVQLMRVKNTSIFTLQARQDIEAGVVLGEYLGVLSLVPGDKQNREDNEGFRLHYHRNSDLWGTQRLCVDANDAGSLMRFLNHSCSSSAQFREVTNIGGRTMVVTTTRFIPAGEEITVNYGDDLWFECLCGACA